MVLPSLKFFLDPSLKENGIIFEPPREGDAGFDLRSAEAVIIPPGAQVVVNTKLKIAVPVGYVALIRERSSSALRRLYTHAGVIDSSYRGDVKIVLSNGGNEPLEIAPGDKIAQLLVIPCLVHGEAVETLEDLGDSERGAGGFGSTGRR